MFDLLHRLKKLVFILYLVGGVWGLILVTIKDELSHRSTIEGAIAYVVIPLFLYVFIGTGRWLIIGKLK